MEAKMHGMTLNIINKSLRSIIILVAICFGCFVVRSVTITDLKKTILAAESGDPKNQVDLVWHYYYDQKDYSETIKWCRVILDNPYAQEYDKGNANFVLGCCYYRGEGVKKSTSDAITYWEKGAELGSASSAYNLAAVSLNDFKDLDKAIIWLERASELKKPKATKFLAELFENGYAENYPGKKLYSPNVSKDLLKSAKYYDLYIGYMNLGQINNREPLQPKIFYKLAQWYYAGEENIPQDYKKAFGYFNHTVEANEICKEEYKLAPEEIGDVLWHISLCYRFGRGVEQDELKARKYFKLAAENGCKQAQDALTE